MTESLDHLHYVQALDPLLGGGLATSATGLHVAMQEQGVSSRLFSTRGGSDQASDIAGVETFQRAGPTGLFYSPGLRHASAREISAMTVVHGHGLFSYPSYAVPIVARREHRPIVFHPHGMLEPWALERSPIRKGLARVLYENRNFRTAAMWRALTDVEASQIRRVSPEAPIFVVPNGVDTDLYHPSVARAEVPTLLYLGRLHPKKGLPMLVKAWAALKDVRGDWRLIIAGPDGSGMRSALLRDVLDMELHGSIQILGEVRGEEKRALLRAAWAFVLPSYSEGFPMAVVEAMASGVPVLATRQSNFAGVEDMAAGFLCDATDAGVRRGLNSLLSLDAVSIGEMGANGRRWVERDFTWSKISAQIVDACRETLE